MTDTEEKQIAAFLKDPLGRTASGANTLRAADAVRALLAERDALKAKVTFKAAAAPVVRKLREFFVKPDMRLRWNPNIGPRAEFYTFNEWRECNHTQVLLYEPELSQLRAHPYETETVEDVLREMEQQPDSASSFVDRLRAAVAAEGVRDV